MKKITVIALVLTLCLAAIGIGYAGWTQNLYIEGTVSTGEVDIDFVGDPGPVTSDNEFPYVNPGPEDVGEITANVSDNDDPGDPDVDYNTIGLSLKNVYAGYEGYVSFAVKNNGTVPVLVTYTLIQPVTGEVNVGLQWPFIGPSGTLLPTQAVQCILTAEVVTDTPGSYSVGASFTAVQEVP